MPDSNVWLDGPTELTDEELKPRTAIKNSLEVNSIDDRTY